MDYIIYLCFIPMKNDMQLGGYRDSAEALETLGSGWD